VLLEHRHARHDAGFAARGEGVQLELRGDESGREFGVGGGSGTRTPDLGSDVMQLLAVLEGWLASAFQVRLGSWMDAPYQLRLDRWLLLYLPRSD
jgi:hypothetical protein